MEKKSCKYSSWANKRLYRIHRAFRNLPGLEEELASVCEELARAHHSGDDTKVEYMIVLTCLAGIRAEVRDAFNALSDIREGIDRLKLTDAHLERRIGTIYSNRPDSNRILAGLRSSGGTRAYLKRMSAHLLRRYESYTECLKILKNFDSTEKEGFGNMVVAVWDRLPGGPGTPGTQYKMLCLAGPWGLLATAAIIAAVLIIGEDEVDDGTLPDGDSGGDDPDENVCYGEGELEPEEQVCHPQ